MVFEIAGKYSIRKIVYGKVHKLVDVLRNTYKLEIVPNYAADLRKF